jgi:hypothetical protein
MEFTFYKPKMTKKRITGVISATRETNMGIRLKGTEKELHRTGWSGKASWRK